MFRSLAAIILSAALSLSALASQTAPRVAATPQADGPTPSVRVTPPAPVISAAERQAELAARRARVAEKVGANGVLVMLSAEPRIYTNDVDYRYRQENNLYYLTNLKQAGATLVMMPGNAQLRELLFLPRRDPARETWEGRMYSPEQARDVSGIGEIWDAREFEPFMQALRERRAYRPAAENILLSAGAPARANAAASAPVSPAQSSAASAPSSSAQSGYESLFAAMGRNEATLYLLTPARADVESREFRQEQRMAAAVAQGSGFRVASALPFFAELRMVKSPMELRLLQHAIDITIEALGRAMAVAGRAQWEYEVEAEVDYTFKRRNADHWGYPSIVGCGPNATTLHYIESQGRVRPGDLLLMDVGAEYEHYTADITRTFPVNGRFTREQADIYNIVLAAQESAFRAIRVGATLSDVHRAAQQTIREGLTRLGLMTDVNSDQQLRLWFMHGTSHWLGMNVHDVATRGATLRPGMVFTVEPGIYIREDALDYLPRTPENERFIAAVRPAFERYKNIGVRIEDDVVVTEAGFRNMTVALPRTIPELEAFIARATRDVRVGALAGQDDSLRAAGAPVESFFDLTRGFSALGRANARWLPGASETEASLGGRTVRRGFISIGTAQSLAGRGLLDHQTHRNDSDAE